MQTGRVVFFNAVKGYGFIAPDDGSADCFVHIDAVEASGLRTLTAEQRVSYEVLTARNGKRSALHLVLG
jgi:CspA family cold shock protein